MAKKRTKEIRKKQFIDSAVQGALVRRSLRHWSVFLVTMFLLSFLIRLLVDGANHNFTDNLRTFWDANAITMVVAFALLPRFFYDWVKWSARFAGPVMRIRRSMRDLAAGHPVAPLRFRAGDFWADMAEDFNVLLERVQHAQQQPSCCPPRQRGSDLPQPNLQQTDLEGEVESAAKAVLSATSCLDESATSPSAASQP